MATNTIDKATSLASLISTIDAALQAFSFAADTRTTEVATLAAATAIGLAFRDDQYRKVDTLTYTVGAADDGVIVAARPYL